MSKILFTVVGLIFATRIVDADNKYPIVFVHGLFGSDIIDDKNTAYWGREQGSFPEMFRAMNYTVFVVKIGKFSSDWDRAVEVYSQIKGGAVDYGYNHSEKSGHLRYGRPYPGLYPKWGEIENGQLNKVHLMGHSMGGTTIRLLAQLLSEGAANAPIPERLKSTNFSKLFEGNKHWVHSITTISTPNQGTTLSDRALKYHDHADLVARGALRISGEMEKIRSLFKNKTSQWFPAFKKYTKSIVDFFHHKKAPSDPVYPTADPLSAAKDKAEKVAAASQNLQEAMLETVDDFKLLVSKKDVFADWVMDQWRPKKDEKPLDFWKRVSSSSDNALVSLSTANALSQNEWVKTLPNVYYYSFVSQTTYTKLFPFKFKRVLPYGTTTPNLMFFSFLTGSRKIIRERGLDDSWLQNDGCVNVPSQLSDGSTPIQYDGKSILGKWMTFKKLAMDHSQTMGSNRDIKVFDVYKNHLRVLADLPHHEDSRDDSEEGHQAPEYLVREVMATLMPLSVEAREMHPF